MLFPQASTFIQLDAYEQEVFDYLSRQLQSADRQEADRAIKRVIQNRNKSIILRCLLLNQALLPFCQDPALNEYWEEYIKRDEWNHLVGNEQYHMQPRKDLSRLEQAMAQYGYKLSFDADRSEEEQIFWWKVAVKYHHFQAVLKQVVLFEKVLLSGAAKEEKEAVIAKLQALTLNTVVIQLTPGFILLGNVYTIIGNVYHEFARQNAQYAALKMKYYELAYQAYVFAEELMGLEASQIAFKNAAFGHYENLVRTFHKPSIAKAKEDLAVIIPGFLSKPLYRQAAERCGLFKELIEREPIVNVQLSPALDCLKLR